jgi:aromatase
MSAVASATTEKFWEKLMTSIPGTADAKAGPRSHALTHDTTVDAPAEKVFGLIADATAWPRIFGPTVHVERLWTRGTRERLQLWATANSAARTWTSIRTLDPTARRIEFRQERSPDPIATMGGCWTFQPLPDGRTRVLLDHDFAVVGDDPAGLRWIRTAVDSNSTAELSALKAHAEAGSLPLEDDFADTVEVDGAAGDVYDFIYRADLWPQRLPHVARLTLTEEQAGLQVMEMETRTADGSSHSTTSVRVCFPPARIVYKQVVVPRLMTVHLGEWSVTPEDGRVTVSSRHTVRINPDTVQSVLGADATIADARQFVRDALSRNSRATLEHARSYAEGRRG